jgi:predicted permease
MLRLETLLRDLSYGARLFRRQPGSTLLAVITLSLGIGANAVIYSLLHAVLLRPLPFPDAHRLVAVVDNFRADGQSNVPPTVPELLDLRAASRQLTGISFFDVRDVQTSGGTEPARAVSARIDSAFLGTLGVHPALGRLFVAGDHTPGRDQVVILTDGFWRRNLAGDPAAVGRRIVVNGAAHEIVGVLPAEFAFDYLSSEPIELYVPFPGDAAYRSRTGEFAGVRRVTAIARLGPDVTLAQAAAEVEVVSERLRTDHPQLYRRGSDGQDRGFRMTVTPLREVIAGRARPVVLLLFGAVGLVLLIACVNTAQFLLARAVERHHEVSIRLALGAGRGRLLRQFLTEASLLALVATGLGLFQAVFLIDLLRVMLSARTPLVAGLGLNLPVMAFTATVAVVVTLACGLFPAIHAARRPAAGSAAREAGASRSRTRHALIVLEVAISVVLLVCAGLLVENLRQLERAPRGYSADDVVLMRMREARREGPGSGTIYRRYLDRIAAIPGVERAAVASAPLPGFGSTEFSIVGRTDDAATLSRQRASWRIVSPGYFDTLRIPIVAGRTFAETDTADRPPVAIVNEEMAGRFWPGQDPIGRQIRSGDGPRLSVATIVGIVGNVRPPLQRDLTPQIYVSYLQQSEPNITLLVRSAAGVAVSPESVKRAIWSVVPEQPLFDIRPMAEATGRSLAEPLLITRLLGGLAVLALLMSTLGVYTVVSYLTARRTKEVALRRAIGADSLDVLRLLGMPTMLWTLVGLAVGVAGAIASAAILQSVVLRAAQLDVPTVATVAIAYVLVVAIAVALPAVRALRIHPAGVLRSE